MSGQRNKKPSDAVKSRQEYLDNLSLEVQLNDANEQAVRQFKETGQVPPISQMKDMRTTTQILADTEKLKISLIKDLEPIADPQFAQAIVSRLVQSPLNIDNRLLVFTAQRVDDIVKNLQKTYKYGIKGDANDAEMFVSFLNKYYTDKNKLTTNTKSFMNRMGSSDVSGASSAISGQHNTLVSLSTEFSALMAVITKKTPMPLRGTPIMRNIATIMDLIKIKLEALIQIMPKTSSLFNQIEKLLSNEEGTTGYDMLNNNYERWLQFVNHSIPNLDYATTLMSDIYNFSKKPIVAVSNLETLLGILERFDDVLVVDLNELQALQTVSRELNEMATEQPYRPEIMQQVPITGDLQPELQDLLQKIGNNIAQMLGAGGLIPANIINPIQNEFTRLQATTNPRDIPKLQALRQKTLDLLREQGIQGQGLNRTFKGRGLTSVDYTKGIEASPRYVKFGRYMINNKKLNDNVLSLRRSKGSAIATIPAFKMTSELGNVFKKIVGGAIPSYDELNALTDGEKRYLFKVSQEADIYDKIKIPTPSKDDEEKDIHAFNVMKGEILAGNNSKELISKFKLLLNKLSKNNILPKSQVREILEELLELNL